MVSKARIQGVTLSQAAIIVGLCYLLNPVSYAEFAIYPKLVVPGNIEQTVANIVAHQGLFLGAFFCYLVNFVEDVVIAWALYILLTPVNQALSLLAALFQLTYAAIAFVGLFNLPRAYNMLIAPEYLTSFGAAQMHAQVNLLLHSFRLDYSLGLFLFGIHLILVGFLIVRSTYIPWWLGVILIINGLGWVITELQPYAYPTGNVDFLFFTFFGELVWMLWLLIRGWTIKDPSLMPEGAKRLQW